jgi:small-conductance mechanosensitive channel
VNGGGIFTPIAGRLLDAAGWHASPWIVGLGGAVLVLLLTAGVGWILKNVVARILRRAAAATATNLDDAILDLVERPMFRMVEMVGVYLAAGELPLSPAWETTTTGVLLILVVFVAVRVATKVAIVLLLAYGSRVSEPANKERFVKDYIPLLSKIIGTIFVVFGLITVLHHFGQDVSSVVAALGIGGLAISFAAKETLGNMFAGFTILVDRPFRPGDRIRLASGEVGDVLEVGTRSTRVRLLDQNMLIVPNSELVNTRVVNFNFPTHATRASLEVGIAYGSDLDRAKQIVRAAIEAEPEVAGAPAVQLSAFGASSLDLAASYIISEFANVAAVQDRMRSRVYNEFQNAGIKIPFPTRELIHSSAPPRS